MAEEKKKRGRLLVISGFSGVGKGTVIRRLMEEHPEYAFSVSATTRAPRPGEIHGKDYFFVDNQTFDRWVEEGRFLEYARHLDKAYGTLRDHVEALREEGRDVILDIEVQGAVNVMAACSDAVSVYIIPPDGRELYRRILGRGTESPEQIRKRLTKAVAEVELVPRYRHVVVNDQVEDVAREIHQLLHQRRGLRLPKREALKKTRQIRRDLEEILKEKDFCDTINNCISK